MEVVLNGQVVEVIIINKKIKNIYFRFDDLGRLVVSSNNYTSKKAILKLIEANRASLERMMLKQAKKSEKERYFWYLGSKYDVVYDEMLKEIEFQDGVIRVRDEEALNRFIKNKTKEIFSQEVLKMREVIKTPDFSLKIRKMKTRWGVCNYVKKTITLNSELIKYRRELLRYVIVHEMCHFYHHDHSKNFWNMVSIYYPEYKMARKELRS